MEMINRLLENNVDSKRMIDMLRAHDLPQAPTRKAALDGRRAEENRTERRARERAEQKAERRARKATVPT